MSCVTPGRLLGAWPVPPAPQGPRLSPLPTLFPQQRTLALSMTQLGPESPSESSKQGCSRGPPRTTVIFQMNKVGEFKSTGTVNSKQSVNQIS